jgi:hypothetical protein
MPHAIAAAAVAVVLVLVISGVRLELLPSVASGWSSNRGRSRPPRTLR